MKYENRIIVYLDILGFKDHIAQTFNGEIDNEEKINLIINALESLKYIGNNLEWSYFSDTIVISFKELKKEQITFTINSIGDLLIFLINKNFICRGYMTFGKLVHSKEYIFGPALIKAYKAEESSVFYPRVVVDKELIKKGLCTYGNLEITEDYLLSYLQNDFDNLLYIDYFEKITSKLSLYELINYCNKLRLIIESGLKKAKKEQNLNILAKYSWMQNKFNSMIESITSEEHLELRRKENEKLQDKLKKQMKI